MAEMFIGIWDEWSEWMDPMRWLYYGNLVRLKNRSQKREDLEMLAFTPCKLRMQGKRTQVRSILKFLSLPLNY